MLRNLVFYIELKRDSFTQMTLITTNKQNYNATNIVYIFPIYMFLYIYIYFFNYVVFIIYTDYIMMLAKIKEA